MDSRVNRRAFLAATAVAATARLSPAPAEDKPAMLPVIDTHQHLWDLTKFKLGWLKPGDALDASYTPVEYAAAIDGLHVVKSVYMEVDVVPEQQQKEADYIVALCESKKTPTCAAVISGRPNAGEAFAKYITPFKGHKYVKGIRQVLHVPTTPAGYCLEPNFVKGIQLLGDLGLSYDLCVRPAELPNYVKLVDQCPGTRFILDHCGNPSAKFTKEQWDQWRKDMDALAAKKNVVSKISGFIANGWEKGKWATDDLAPAVNGTIGAFGVDRVMFGGDWPVVTLAATYKEWLTALRAIIASRPEADQRKILHDNAANFYRI
ncbi:amidohydrolase family protein [Fimbriiglobus ruber]|uniref:L-fuconolactone hydrolase n=1 Tax=Fimbriiglobus ruber TaxID=1908690 RepID=A0A225DVR7_9BACT|nr:amidohydrolase family protein [Fimbriiglobus ruber]OWK45630.1 L-fuconolactone hydrolase [Fimbriiglobus ruber]